MKKFSLLILLAVFKTAFAQKDTLRIENIQEVVVKSDATLKLHQKNGKYEVSVAGTNFQNMPNTWEGLKQVPILRAMDGTGLKVNNKAAIILINGIQTQMTGTDLENYLKSLDPKTIKKIEIISNPDASYGTEVQAVVNIILSQKQGSYRLGINTTNGFHTKYYNNSNINYAINGKKIRFYANYTFDYLPKRNSSEISQKIGSLDLLQLNYTEKDKLRKHQALMNLNFDLSKKDQIDLTAVGSLTYDTTDGKSYNDIFSKEINLKNDIKNLQFAEVWKHNFNDTVSLKIGSYQVFSRTDVNNASNTNAIMENQHIQTKIPLYIAFADYINMNKYGLSSAGLRFNNINVSNNNYVSNQNSPFSYKEKVLAGYANHSILFSETKTLDLGIRSETTMINYAYSNDVANIYYNNKNNYISLLYNAAYNWTTKAERTNSLAFRKQIQRPNYSYLNPFQSISSDVTYFSGDSKINPAKIYSLSYETSKKSLSIYAQSGIMKDFISSFYQTDNNYITQTYKNFNTVYFIGTGAEFNHSFFKKKWTTKTTFDLTYFNIQDNNYNVSKSTPNINFGTINIINLGGNFILTPQYQLSLPYKDGLIKHHSTQKLDLTLSKKLNKNFTLVAFIYDILKTSYSWEETTITNYLYGSKYYNDVRSFGITLKWNVTGKSYKSRTLETPDGEEINRLKK